MCGIVGIVDIKSKREINPDILIRMRDCMVHRGPDEAGDFYKAGVGFAHRRLSIIDRASGQQPLTNNTGDVTITFNGEIYNFKEITEQLKQKGYQFLTRSDTETILHAWSEWGENCVDHLRGMFVFAIWDDIKQTLFIARDRMGIKPVLYTQTDDGYLIFASEIKALLQYPQVKRKLYPPSIENYFAFGYVPEPDTIYSGIYKLSAGHTLTLKNGVLGDPQQYWDIPFENGNPVSYQNAQDELLERLREAINIRLVSEVPLGAFLSGGVDSSAVVALMAQSQEDPLHTCSIGFNNKDFDESAHALQIAEQYKTDHHHNVVDDQDYSLVPKLAEVFDEPFSDSSALPTYRVCQLARENVTVALSGDGSDELMSGYRRHQWHMKEERLRAGISPTIRKHVFGLLGAVYPKADWAPKLFRAKSTFQSLATDSISAYFHTVTINSNDVRTRLFSEKFRKQLDGYHAMEVFQRHSKNAPSEDPMSVIQYLDLKTYLIDDILTKVDRCSMAHSLEVRVPFIDHKFVEWMSGVPSGYKIRNGVGKAILKSSMEDHLPHDILYRKKMGFSVPLAQWFRGPLAERASSALLGENMKKFEFFDQRYLQKVVRDHQSGIRDNSVLIWSLLMFEAFLASNGFQFD